MSHDERVRSLLTVDDRLDDIKRAQIWSRIEDDIARAPARRAWWPALALAGAAAAAVALWLATHHSAGETVLVAPSDTTLSARLGPHTRAALVGPARLDVVAAGDASVVRLGRGTLLADFTGGPGRSLRVEAPGAIVDIVGTLFAIEVRDDDTCVSVSHGRVRVTSPSAIVFVSGGQTWCRSRTLAPITPSISDALAHHEAVITADARPPADSPRVEPTAAPAPAPVAPAPVEPAPVEPAPRVEPPRVESHEPARVESHEPARAESHPRESHPRIESPRVEAQPHLAAVTEPAPAEPPAQPPPESSPSPSPPPSPSPSPSPSPPPPPSPKPPAPTADSLYASAESSLAHNNLPAADRTLSQLLTSFPDSPLADQALYERARIAYQRHAYSDARTHLSRLAEHTSSPLLEPGAYMTCRIAVETHDAAAEPCLLSYRRTYPRSPHDLDVLGLLAELAYSTNKCTAAAPFVLELRRRYDTTSLARAWRVRCP